MEANLESKSIANDDRIIKEVRQGDAEVRDFKRPKRGDLEGHTTLAT